MADNTTLDPGTGGDVIATDDVAGVKYQRVKLVDGTADSTAAIPGDATNGLDVDVTRVQGTVTVDGSGVTQPVSGTVTADTELTTGDLDTGAGTDTRAVIGIVGSASGGGQIIPGDTTNGLDVDVTRVSGTVTISGAVTNAGTFAVQESGSALTALQLIDDTVVADDAAFTVATTKVNMAGFLADQSSTDSVNEGDAGAARMTLDRKQIVTVAPSSDTEGLSIFRTLDADETEEDVKTSAGKLYGWYLYNDGATEVYVKFYNATAANTTVGSTTPILTIPVPAGAAANVEFTNGIKFDTALCIAATTAVADADTTAPAANQCIANVFYQ